MKENKRQFGLKFKPTFIDLVDKAVEKDPVIKTRTDFFEKGARMLLREIENK